MMLAKSEQAPSQLTIDKFKKQVPSFTVVSPGGHFNLRLDLCLGDKTRLDSVIYATQYVNPKDYQFVKTDIPSSAWEDVIGGDLHGLVGMIELANKEDASMAEILYLVPAQIGDVTGLAIVDVDKKLKVESIEVLLGNLIEGDPFHDNKCQFGQQEAPIKFMLGSASFTGEACTFLGGGETTGYEIISLTVHDTNPLGGKVLFSKEDIVKQNALKYQWNHHNGCDSMMVKTPFATYAMTSAPIAGCGKILEGAPQRDMLDNNPNVIYTVKYKGKKETTHELKCGHYLFGCQTHTDFNDLVEITN